MCTTPCGKEEHAPRILLADDHAIFREGLKVILEEEGFQIVGEASDGYEAVKLCAKLRPDVAVLDISMPLLNGVDAAREILKANPQTRIIHLTVHTQDHYVIQSLQVGVTGYVLKANAADELVDAIRAVCKGGMYLTSGVSHGVFQTLLKRADPLLEPLSLRERQVLQLIAEGKSPKEIGAVLGVSSRTADSHRAKIMEKLGVRDIAGLVRYAIRIGLVSREEP